MADRAELEQALRDGCAVEVTGWPHPISNTNGRRLERALKDLRKATAQLGENLDGTITRDAAGRLTHAGMKVHLDRGESVMVGDDVVTSHADLPHPADLAAGSEKQLAAVEEDLNRRQADLAADRERLAAARKQAKEDTKAAQKAAAAEEEEVKGAFAGMDKEELQALADQHNVTVEGRATKPKLAAALAAAGVQPPQE